jgi:tetratricopeptide (TPR) repeat protein
LSSIVLAIAVLTGLLIVRAKLASPSAAEVNRLLSESRHKELQDLREVYSADQSAINFINSLSGDFEMQRQRWRAALNHYSQITSGSPPEIIHAQSSSAHCLLNMGLAAESERLLRIVLAQAPQHHPAQRDLANILLASGRSYEAVPHLEELIRQGKFEPIDLVVCASPELFQLAGERFAQTCLSAIPEDPRPMLGLARSALQKKQFEFARLWLSDIVSKFPAVLEAQTRLGQLHLELGEFHQLKAWHEQLPESSVDFAGIWFVKAQIFQHLGQREAASRCLAETLTRFPDHVSANYQMTTTLKNMQRVDDSKHFAERAQLLARIELLANDLRDAFDTRMCQEMVNSMARLDRYSEAAAWCEIAKRNLSTPTWFENFLRQCNNRKLPDIQRKDHPAVAGVLERLKQLPLPPFDWASLKDEQPQSSPDAWPISFTEEAESVGLNFIYRNGSARDSTREYLFEFNGGGIGVLDFDGDGWPDLAFTQAGEKPWTLSPESDQLFRNLDGQRFQLVTELAGFTDTSYGQGITSGDINNDGFPDLYVANFGLNQLYINNGDGTFSNSDQAGNGHQWTSSCAIADLNGDGSPDIYAVNYLDAEEVERSDCHNSQPLRCSPSNFVAGRDAVFLNQHDGSFADLSVEANVRSPLGKGLGLVVADFNEDSHLDVFVGNDTTQNNLFINTAEANDGIPVFDDQALLAGVAFDHRGIAQACMGIAAASLNFDGRPDLFVTNFYNDSNTLYAAQGDGTFRDQTRESNLGQLSFSQLGFGTQFLDADLDGDLDLVVANGHIYRFPLSSGIPYRMAPQVLKNSAGRFELVPDSDAGSFFATEQLGRSVARLDWNRDGRPDICISHLDSPVALLQNETQPVKAMLTVRLVGVQSSRDAIGARVSVLFNDEKQTQQLMTGDGYQSRNEQSLSFAVPAGLPLTVVVDWPSELQTKYQAGDVASVATIIVVENGKIFRQPP